MRKTIIIIVVALIAAYSCSNDDLEYCQDKIQEINDFYSAQLGATNDQQQINNIMEEYTLALSKACN